MFFPFLYLFFQADDGIRYDLVTGVQTCALPIWYLATLVLLSVFTIYRFPIVWSLVIILSYQAYANLPWKENLWFVGLEYAIVYGYLIWELFFKNHHKKQYFDAHDSHAVS